MELEKRKRTEVVKQFEDLGWDDLDSVIPPDLYFGVRGRHRDGL